MVTEPLYKLAKAARFNACLYLGLALLATAGAAAVWYAGSPKLDGRAALFVGIYISVYLAPAALLLIFANRLEAGHQWAGTGILVLAILIIANTTWGLVYQNVVLSGVMGFSLCALIGSLIGVLPSVYLAAMCLAAAPEIRHLRRHNQRHHHTGGFPVMPADPRHPSMMTAKTPPRPGQSTRTPPAAAKRPPT